MDPGRTGKLRCLCALLTRFLGWSSVRGLLTRGLQVLPLDTTGWNRTLAVNSVRCPVAARRPAGGGGAADQTRCHLTPVKAAICWAVETRPLGVGSLTLVRVLHRPGRRLRPDESQDETRAEWLPSDLLSPPAVPAASLPFCPLKSRSSLAQL